MKASLKFRDDQKPLIRAKVPLSILGLPFQSGIVAGEPKELTLNLATFFESGPSLRISYRPNDSLNPFSLVVKTGTGPLGSPIASSMSMSAEFDLVHRANPRFMLHFRPAFGDFSIKKTQSSVIDKKKVATVRGRNGVNLVEEEDSTIEVVESPAAAAPTVNGGYLQENVAFFGKRIAALTTPETQAGLISSLLSGVEVAARTVVPVRKSAVVSFRWGLRVPVEMDGGRLHQNAGINRLQKIPFLVMNKIGIEHVEAVDSSKELPKVGPEPKLPSSTDVVEACFSMKRQLEVLQAENGSLKKAIDDLRQEFAAKNSGLPMAGLDSSRYWEFERNGNKGSSGRVERRNNEKKSTVDSSVYSGKSMEVDVSEELKKALKGASGA